MVKCHVRMVQPRLQSASETEHRSFQFRIFHRIEMEIIPAACNDRIEALLLPEHIHNRFSEQVDGILMALARHDAGVIDIFDGDSIQLLYVLENFGYTILQLLDRK